MIEVEQNLNEPPFFGAEVSGSFQIKVIEVKKGKNGEIFELEIEGLTEEKFSVSIDVEDAGGNNSAPDPGDVFRTLMELLRRYACPQCL